MDPARFSDNPSGQLVDDFADTKEGSIPYKGFMPNPLPPEMNLSWTLIHRLLEAERELGKLINLGINEPISTLLRSAFIHREAVLSSRIEGTRTLIADLYAFEAGQIKLSNLEAGLSSNPTLADVREVENNVKALEMGLKQVTEDSYPVNLWLIRELHKVLMEGVRGNEANPGDLRQLPVVIGEQMPTFRETIAKARFIPPPAIQMRAALEELLDYIAEEESDQIPPPLIRIALIHYQFETVHPFRDGNGRIGRLLISLLLVVWKVVPTSLFNLSNYLEQHRSKYYDHMLEVSEKSSWNQWLEFFLEGIIDEARNASKKATELLRLLSEMKGRIQSFRSSSTLNEVVEFIFEKPIIRAIDIQEKFAVSHNTAMKSLRSLVEMGFLQDATQAERNKAYIAPQIMRILNER